MANDTVSGMGQSASLLLYGNLTLAGTFRTGAIDMALFYQPMQGSYTSASLTVTGAGNSLRASSVHAAGNLLVSDGAAVTVVAGYDIQSGRPGNGNDPHYQLDGIAVDGAGSRLEIGGLLSTDNASDILVTDGGNLQARRMTLDNTYGGAGYQADAQSTIEVGTDGNAAAGTWTVDAGSILTADNKVTLNAPLFVINGVVIDNGGLDLQGAARGSQGDVTGSGKIRINANALLTVDQSGAQLSVMFNGNNAELSLGAGVDAFSSRIWGFAAGDSIAVSGTSFDSASWRRGALDLFSGGALVGTLKMAGNYTGDNFSVSNGTITLTASISSSTAERAAPKSLQLFTQAMASFERHTSALHEASATVAQTSHPMLAAAH